jgi:hypothetical protein
MLSFWESRLFAIAYYRIFVENKKRGYKDNKTICRIPRKLR